jgi:hypothetical protein
VRIANRFSIAVHILSLLGALRDAAHTSAWTAGTVGVSPVVVRNVTGMLRRAGLVFVRLSVFALSCSADAYTRLFGIVHRRSDP